MIPLASLGLLQPVLATGAMAFSSVSVLSNSLLFRRYTRITITSSSAASGELPTLLAHG